MTVKELREKRNALVPRMRELADKSSDKPAEWTETDEQNWRDLNAEFDKLGEQEKKQERADAVQKEMAARADASPDAHTVPPMPDGSDAGRRTTAADRNAQRADAIAGWVLTRGEKAGHEINGRSLAPTDEQRKAMEALSFQPERNFVDIPLPHNYSQVRRALEGRATTYYVSTGTGYGGETIPEGFVPDWELALLAYGGARNVATIMRTTTGNDLPWPNSNDTGNAGELLDEAADSTDTAASEQGLTTSSVTFKAYKWSSKIIRVSAELIQDTAFNIVAHCGAIAGERIGRGQAPYFATGTGTSQPQGIVTGSALGATAASATALVGDDLLALVHSVDPAYRTLGCGWLMHDSVVLHIRKIKDEDDQYIWQPGLQAGKPDVLLGYPLSVDQSMASTVEADAKVALFGMLSKFVIRDVATLRLKHLVERYAEYDQEAFLALMRCDAHVIDAGTYPIRHLLMASGDASGSGSG